MCLHNHDSCSLANTKVNSCSMPIPCNAYLAAMKAVVSCLQEVNAGGQVVREIWDKLPQRWRFCSTDTVLLLDRGAAKTIGPRFAKIRADDFQQWTVLSTSA